MGGRSSRTPARRLSCPTCGSAISCAATRSCSYCARAFPNVPLTCCRPRSARPLPTTCPACARPLSSISRASAWVSPTTRRWGGACRVRAMARRSSCRGNGKRRSRRFSRAFPSAPALSARPEFILLNDLRFGERALPRMVDRCAALALPRGAQLPEAWPAPRLDVPAAEAAAWRAKRGLTADGRPVIALAPGAVGPSKRWPAASYAALTRRLAAEGVAVWVLGGPDEKPLATEIIGDTPARDLTGPDLRDAILALASASVAVSNNSGLLHVAAALGTPAIGIFGPTSPMALGAAQPARGNDGDDGRAALPAMPQTGMPARPSPLHARHRSGGGPGGDPPRPRRGRRGG